MENVYLITLSRNDTNKVARALSHFSVSWYGEALVVAPGCFEEVVWVLQNHCSELVLRGHHLIVIESHRSQVKDAVFAIPRFYPKEETHLGVVQLGFLSQAATVAATAVSPSIGVFLEFFGL